MQLTFQSFQRASLRHPVNPRLDKKCSTHAGPWNLEQISHSRDPAPPKGEPEEPQVDADPTCHSTTSPTQYGVILGRDASSIWGSQHESSERARHVEDASVLLSTRGLMLLVEEDGWSIISRGSVPSSYFVSMLSARPP